jgi:hypothetical protein
VKPKLIFCLALVLSSVLFLCNSSVSSDTNSAASKPIDCWKKGAAIYRDRNHDGKIDWEVSGSQRFAEGADVFKVDTNYDGYYDVESCFGYPITGKPTTYWIKSIHERVPAIGKDFVPIEKPAWVE